MLRAARLAWVSGERGRVIAVGVVVVLGDGLVGGRVGGGIVVDFPFSIYVILV